MALTEHILNQMFAIKVENVNCEANIFEEGVMFDMLGKGAIVVKKKDDLAVDH